VQQIGRTQSQSDSMLTDREIRKLVNAELAKVIDPSRRAAIQAILVLPQILHLEWNYGNQGERFECWLVGLSIRGERLVYCDAGFGPTYPWGVLDADDQSLGRDDQWHLGLEHDAIGARILEPPLNYRVP